MFTSTRAALALVVMVLGVLALGGVSARHGRAWQVGARVLVFGVVALCVGVIARSTSPGRLVGALALGSALPCATWGALRAPAENLRPAAPLHALALAGAVQASVIFAALLPRMPSITRLHWAGLGEDGYGSPTKLWWTLAVVAVDFVLVLAAWRALRPSEQPLALRRALLALAEWTLTGCTLGACAAWIGSALAMLPGGPPVAYAAIAAAALSGGGLLVGFTHVWRARKPASHANR